MDENSKDQMNSIKVKIENMPKCSEKLIQEMIIELLKSKKIPNATEMKKKKEDLINLMKEEKVWSITLTQYLDDIIAGDCKQKIINLRVLLSKLRDLDVQEIKRLIEENEQDMKKIKENKIYILFGQTGAGKSTILHYLAGSTMSGESGSDGFPCMIPENTQENRNKSLDRVIVSENRTISETRLIIPVVINDGHKKPLIICDSPGFGDTRGAEIDIANSIALKNAIDQCEAVKPIVVVTRNMGEKLQEFPKLTHVLVDMIPDKRILKQNVHFIFNKYSPEEGEGLLNLLKKIQEENEKTAPERVDKTFEQIIDVMIENFKTHITVMDFSIEKRFEILRSVCNDNLIGTPSRYFNIPLSLESKQKLIRQMEKHFELIKNCLNRGAVELALYKAEELDYLRSILKHLDIKDTLTDLSAKFVDDFDKECKDKRKAFNSKIDKNEEISTTELTSYWECIEKSLCFDKIMKILNAENSNRHDTYVKHLEEKTQLIYKNTMGIRLDSDDHFDKLRVHLHNLKWISTNFEKNFVSNSDQDLYFNIKTELKNYYSSACNNIFANVKDYLSNNIEKVIEEKSKKNFQVLVNEMGTLKKYEEFAKYHVADLGNVREKINEALKNFFGSKIETVTFILLNFEIEKYGSLEKNELDKSLKTLEEIDSFFSQASKIRSLDDLIESKSVNAYNDEYEKKLNEHFRNAVEYAKDEIESGSFDSIERLFEIFSIFKINPKIYSKIKSHEENLQKEMTSKIEYYKTDIISSIETYFKLKEKKLNVIEKLDILNSINWFDKIKSNAIKTVFRSIQNKIKECLDYSVEKLKSIRIETKNHAELKLAFFEINKLLSFIEILDKNYPLANANDLKELILEHKRLFDKDINKILKFLKEAHSDVESVKSRIKIEYDKIEEGNQFLKSCVDSMKELILDNKYEEIKKECEKNQLTLNLYLSNRKEYLEKKFDENFSVLIDPSNFESDEKIKIAEKSADELLLYFKELKEVEKYPVCSVSFKEHGEILYSGWVQKIAGKFYEFNSDDLTDPSIQKRRDHKLTATALRIFSKFDDYLSRDTYFLPLYYQCRRTTAISDKKLENLCKVLIEERNYQKLKLYFNLFSPDRADKSLYSQLVKTIVSSLTNYLTDTKNMIRNLKNDLGKESNDDDLKKISENLEQYCEAKFYLKEQLDKIDELDQTTIDSVLTDIKKNLQQRVQQLNDKWNKLCAVLDLDRAEKYLIEIKHLRLIIEFISKNNEFITALQSLKFGLVNEKNEESEKKSVIELNCLKELKELEKASIKDRYKIMNKMEEFIDLKETVKTSIINLFEKELKIAEEIQSIHENEQLNNCIKYAKEYLPDELKETYIDPLIDNTKKAIQENILKKEIEQGIDLNELHKKYSNFKEEDLTTVKKKIETHVNMIATESSENFQKYLNEGDMSKEDNIQKCQEEFNRLSTILSLFSGDIETLKYTRNKLIDDLNATSDGNLKKFEKLSYKTLDQKMSGELQDVYKRECLLFNLDISKFKTEATLPSFKTNLTAINTQLKNEIKTLLDDKKTNNTQLKNEIETLLDDKKKLETWVFDNFGTFKCMINFAKLVEAVKTINSSFFNETDDNKDFNLHEIEKTVSDISEYLLNNLKSKQFIEYKDNTQLAYKVTYEEFYECLFNVNVAVIKSVNEALKDFKLQPSQECFSFLKSKMTQFYETGAKCLNELLKDINLEVQIKAEEKIDSNLANRFISCFYNLKEFDNKSKPHEKLLKEGEKFHDKEEFEELFVNEIKKKIKEIVRAVHTSQSNEMVMVAYYFCIMEELSNKLFIFKEVIDPELGKCINEYINTNRGFNSIAPLAQILNESVNGKKIVSSHKIFESYKRFLFNKNTKDRDIDKVLEELKNNKENNYTVNKTALRNFYLKYKEIFESLVLENLNPSMDLNKIKSNIMSKATELKDRIIKEDPLKWDKYIKGENENKDNSKNHLAYLIANIVAFYSLTGAKDYFNVNNSTNTVTMDHIFQVHPAQVLAIGHMLGFGFGGSDYLRNCLIQIGTGEGKSVTLAITAVVLALLDFDIYCVCYSKYLSNRDYEDFKVLFEELKLISLIHYGTFNEICELVINEHGDLRNIIKNFILNDNIVLEKNANTVFKTKVLLIDEVDVFFSQSFYGNNYNPCLNLTDPSISNLLDYIWSKRQAKLTLTEVLNSAEFNECANKLRGWENLLHSACKQLLYDLMTFESHEYMRKDDKIGYLEHDSVVFDINYGYKTLFAYYLENERGKISNESLRRNKSLFIKLGSFSYAEIPRKDFKLILGVTGTLHTLNDKQKDIIENDYNIKLKSYIPSVYEESKLAFRKATDLHLVMKQETFFTNIVEEIKKRIVGSDSIRRAVFVFFETNKELNDFYNSSEFTDSEFVGKTIFLTEEASDQEKKQIANGVVSDKVFLITKIFGRGTDFKTFDDRVKKDGIHVIQTFFSDELSEEVQIKGRTARQGEKGSFSIVVLHSRLERYQLFAENIENIKKTHPDQLYDHLNIHRIRYFENLYQETINKVKYLKEKHNKSTKFIESLVDGNTADVKTVLINENVNPNSSPNLIGSFTNSKTLILMDATGSMSDLLGKTKDTLETMFLRTFTILNDPVSNFGNKSFQIKICVYRNYNAPIDRMLQNSSWENGADNLIRFLSNINAEYGQGNEAIELAFWQANQESDLSQIILIGDAPPNTQQEVIEKRKTRLHKLNNSVYQNETFYMDELKKLIDKRIPVHAYYVAKRAQDSFEQIARDSGGFSEPLDIYSPDGSDLLIKLVTEQLLRNIGGEVLVEAYRSKTWN